MKTTVIIIAENASGQVAKLSLETDLDWLAMLAKDASQMEGFTPARIKRVMVMDERGYGTEAVLPELLDASATYIGRG